MKENFNNKGVTLIEILIGIIITSIMVGAMYTSYNVGSGAYKQVSDKAKISSSSRDLVQMIMRDIRMAGFRYYSGSHAKEQFRLDPNNATCVATVLHYLIEIILFLILALQMVSKIEATHL